MNYRAMLIPDVHPANSATAPEVAAEALAELAALHLDAGEREEALALARACEELQRND
jgi:hypothetical protein